MFKPTVRWQIHPSALTSTRRLKLQRDGQIVPVRAEHQTVLDDFSAAILQLLRGEAGPTGMSVPRLGKALGRSASEVMRQLTLMGDVCGMGWVHVQPLNDRFMVTITDAGRKLFKSQPQSGKK